ncbi:hypothetical protein [Paenibacillus cremeus]|uniref:Uncharacterized protein n=1 Tax=Paenibacillus cremeus TaxID=2163881 RepID=A0A559K4Z5_9BACL|nr:hypothetical protein [Paenibacillus cremeus]TVY07177.1 hypothetical protein FPZ49_25030 [Paenibacillus cremeus]
MIEGKIDPGICKRIGNDAIELDFGSESHQMMPVAITNKLAGTVVQLMDTGFALVLLEGDNLIQISSRDMRCTSIDQTAGESICIGMVSDEFGILLLLNYSVTGHRIRQTMTVRNESGSRVHIREVILLQANTPSEIRGQTSSHDLSRGDAGLLDTELLTRVDAHPLFIDDHLFIGIDWPVAENSVQGRMFRCMQFVGEDLAPGESFEFRHLSIGASLPGVLPQTFLSHLKELRGRKTRRASLYFDWLVHASEGLHEQEFEQLLDYFALLREVFGIHFDLFCADDGIFETRWETTFDLYRMQHESLFPNGFAKMSERIKSMGMECGAWLGPDGFGETKEDEQQRIDTVVAIIKEHGIGIIKLDVCVSVPLGNNPYHNERYLRKLERMVAACRTANPNIIIINHRVSSSPYILTLLDSTLWMGAESYPDHFLYSEDKPRLFTRFGSYGRGEPTYYGAYSELLEDHGVCFNGFLEGWREELAVQTFGRALMLSPEIYGALFLLPDEDYPELARMMKLAEQFRDLMAHTIYDRTTGDFYHSDGKSALLCLVNDSWETVTREIRVGGMLGLQREVDAYQVIRHYPSCDTASYNYAAWDGKLQVQMSPFQVCVLEIKPKETSVTPRDEVRIVTLPEDRIDRSSVYLGLFEQMEPELDDIAAAEWVRFSVSSDPTEVQVMNRARPSQFSEVNRSRQFFREKLRKECYGNSSNAWDGDPTTAWGDSLYWRETDNVWRLDLGEHHRAARMEVMLANIGPGPVLDWVKGRVIPRTIMFEVSADAREWHAVEAVLYYRRQPIEPRTIAHKLIADLAEVDLPIRFIRMHMNGVLIGDIRVQTRENGELLDVPRHRWKGNNLLTSKPPLAMFKKSFNVDEAWEGRYAAVLVELPEDTKVWLKQEIAGAWIQTTDGRKWPLTDASPAFPFNGWEGNANRKGHCWTFRLSLTTDMCNLPLTFCLAWYGVNEELKASPVPKIKGYIIAVK